MRNVPTIDQSGMYAIEDAILELHKKNITVVLSEIQKQPKDMLKKIKLIPELVVEENIFSTFNQAIRNLNSCNLNFKDIADGKADKHILWRY
jgi:SulP family sulfate permease